MAKSGYGLRGAYGRESTWGTAVTPSRSFRLVSSTLERVVPKERRPYLLHATSSANTRAHIRTADNVAGTVVYEFGHEGMGPLVADAFGAAPTTSGAGPYVHTYKLGIGQMVGATLQTSWYDNDTGTERGEIFEGLVASRAEWSVRIGESARLTVDYMGQTSGGETGTLTDTTTAPYTTNDLPALFNQAGSVVWNSVTLAVVTSIRVSIDNKLTLRPFIGSLNTAKPLRNDHCEIMVELDLEWQGTVFDTGLTADTEASFTVTFTNGSAILAITGHNAYVERCSRPISTAGLIRQTVTLRCQSNGTNEGVSFVETNSQSAYDAA